MPVFHLKSKGLMSIIKTMQELNNSQFSCQLQAILAYLTWNKCKVCRSTLLIMMSSCHIRLYIIIQLADNDIFVFPMMWIHISQSDCQLQAIFSTRSNDSTHLWTLHVKHVVKEEVYCYSDTQQTIHNQPSSQDLPRWHSSMISCLVLHVIALMNVYTVFQITFS